MDKRKQDVYGIGIVFILLAILLSILTGNQITTIGWNISTWVLIFFDGVSGVFGIGCLLKPNSFGMVILRLIENYQKSQAERSGSSTKQTQIQSDGSAQVTGDQARVNITNVYPTEKKSEQIEKPERKWLINTTIVLDNEEYRIYDLDLRGNENLVGEVSAKDIINVFLVDKYALDKYEDDEPDFSYEIGEERTRRTRIDFTPSDNRQWYLIVENEESDETEVDIRLGIERSRGFIIGRFGPSG
jgi:hypothetical protein